MGDDRRGAGRLHGRDRLLEASHDEDEVYSDEAFKEAPFGYLNLSIEEILESENPIIRAFRMLDRRMGKRRLAAFDAKKETALLRRLHAFRCEVEGRRAPYFTRMFLNCQGSLSSMSSGNMPGRPSSGVQSV
ncbi:SF0329 family protein [Methylocystis parvus]|uniref:SF0329 family protein n=1 Tax=Methylocystis parvus TaxID=134 RepID=UPI003C74F2F6